MDAAKLLEEYRLAQEEHARAVAIVKEMRERVEAARVEAEQARATERKYERDAEIAAAQLAEGLRALHVDEHAAPSSLLLPSVREYLVEYHANIGCYHCYLRLDGDAAPSTVDTSALSVSVELTKVSFSSAASVWWSVQLERKVDAENCVITAKNDHIYVRLPVNESDKETVDGFSSFSQTVPGELRVDNYRKLSCRGCGFVLMDDAQRIEKVLPLPSENWMEMFDFWGAGIGSFEHIPREGIFAHEYRVFVGESHIILHEGDLVAQALKEEAAALAQQDREEDEPQDWTNVCCSACGVVIGGRRVETPATLRLQKHLLVASSTSPLANGNIFEHYTIDSTVSAQMLHVADSDGIFRFLLRSSEKATEAVKFDGLQLQLLSWDAKIQASVSPSSPDFRRVLKVVYTRGPGVAVSSAVAQTELPPMLRTQELIVTPAIGAEVARRLELSTQLLPPSQRSFNKMTVGFLYA